MVTAGTFRAVVLGILALWAGGCVQSRTGSYDLEIGLDPVLQAGPTPSLTVDFVALSEHEAAAMRAYDPARWFSGGDPRRTDAAKLTATFAEGDTETKTLRRRDEPNATVWKRWRDGKAGTLFVMVNLPSASARRMLELPLDQQRWKGTDTIRLEVTPTEIRSLNGPEPEPAS